MHNKIVRDLHRSCSAFWWCRSITSTQHAATWKKKIYLYIEAKSICMSIEQVLIWTTDNWINNHVNFKKRTHLFRLMFSYTFNYAFTSNMMKINILYIFGFFLTSTFNALSSHRIEFQYYPIEKKNIPLT